MAKAMPRVSIDQKTYTFHLRHGSKWCDGKEVTAADFVYAWQRMVTPATKPPYMRWQASWRSDFKSHSRDRPLTA